MTDEARTTGRSIIEFVGVGKAFGECTVLKNISFRVLEGTIFGIIGPSGAGKTTLLRLLIRFYEPTDGRIYCDGKPIADVPTTMFGFATQDDSFYDELTCFENLEYFGCLYGLSRTQIEENATENLSLVGLAESRDTVAKDLSGGMRRRLDLATALMHRPRILILDEPVASLDPKLRKQIWALLAKIKERGITIIVSSHLLTEMEHFCDEVAILQDGRILEVGTPDLLKSAYSRNEEIRIETAEGVYEQLYAQIIARGVPVTYARLEEHLLILYVPQAEFAVRATLDAIQALGHHLMDLDVNRPSLNEVFEAIIDQQERAAAAGQSTTSAAPLRSHPLVEKRQPGSGLKGLLLEAKELLRRKDRTREEEKR